MSQPFDHYADAVRQLLAVQARVAAHVDRLPKLTAKLQTWRERDPLEANGELEALLKEWPSREELLADLKALRDATAAVQRAYQEVPVGERPALKRPADFKPG